MNVSVSDSIHVYVSVSLNNYHRVGLLVAYRYAPVAIGRMIYTYISISTSSTIKIKAKIVQKLDVRVLSWCS